MFHLFLVINEKYGLEKNEVINVFDPIIDANTECRDINTRANVKTIGQMMENTRIQMRNKFFAYDARSNNCQDFVTAILRTNFFSTPPEVFAFVKQDAEKIFNSMPAFVSKFAKAVTDIAGRADVLIQGAGMESVKNKPLWENIKQELRQKHVTQGKRWNAYLSGLLVQEYKRRGGQFKDDDELRREKTDLYRWFQENWKNLTPHLEYPVYRPTKRITKKTPLTANEINPVQLQEQIQRKQKIKGSDNLPPFKPKAKPRQRKPKKKAGEEEHYF
jgi:hypothetical protein